MNIISDDDAMNQQILVEKIREDFPIFKQKVRNNLDLVYLDNAATTQKPRQVIESLTDYYTHWNSNVHRGIHYLSEVASDMYEKAHQDVGKLIGASMEEIIFTKNTTEGLNLVARGLEQKLKPGDEIVLSRMEHHSNLVPFQIIAKRTGAKLKFIETSNSQLLDIHSAEKVITDNTKLVSVPHMSNVLGSINPMEQISEIAHEHNSLFMIDGAQSVPHIPINVKTLNPDFLAFSGHKMLAPMGIGTLYGKASVLEEFEPLLYGGDMIRSVSYESATWNDLPWKFEAGTPNVGGGIAFGTAVNYLLDLDMHRVRRIEHDLTNYLIKRMKETDYVKIFGPEDINHRGGVVSFNIFNKDGMLIHPHDVSTLLDEKGIAIRAGHHCAQPLIESLHTPATNRISFYIYNTFQEIDYTLEVLENIHTMFS